MPEPLPDPVESTCVYCGRPALYQQVNTFGRLTIACWWCEATGPTERDPGPMFPDRWRKPWELWKKRAKP